MAFAGYRWLNLSPEDNFNLLLLFVLRYNKWFHYNPGIEIESWYVIPIRNHQKLNKDLSVFLQ